jgi:hypothetical protein
MDVLYRFVLLLVQVITSIGCPASDHGKRYDTWETVFSIKVMAHVNW